MSRWINANYGTVRAVSRNKDTIKIVAPRGGIFECRNEGFEVGQAVCFILDTLNRHIVKVLPKEVADMQALMGLNPDLQEIMQDEPLVSIKGTNTEESNYGKIININDKGHSTEEYIDIVSGIAGEPPEGGDDSDWPEYQF